MYPVVMYEVLSEIGRVAAAAASLSLAQQSFGALEAVELDRVDSADEMGELHYRMYWRVISMGSVHSRVCMVILPEFLDGENGDPEWLAEQMASFIVERTMTEVQDLG